MDKNKMFKSLFFYCICFATFFVSAYGQSEPTVVEQYTSLLNDLKWREIGPARGGRSCAVSGVRNNPNLYYAGYTGGGVWKTTDAGLSWENISDGYFGGSIGAVAVYQKNPKIIYVGEGEKTVRGDVSSGWGMWKSTDAGKTWKHIGLRESRLISRIRIHPENPDIVYVAVLGDLWKSSENRGVYKTTDGGDHWERILFANKDAGAVDLILDPANSEKMYATTYRVRRNGYRLDSGGEGSHIWKSENGGKDWVIISGNPGLPKGLLGNIGITVSPANTKNLWAIVEAVDGGLYSSDDGGETWKRTSDFVELYQKAYYFNRIYADPLDENKLIVINVKYHISEDGGYTFKSKYGNHVDHHDLWIDPDNPSRMIIANDGGAQISTNGGKIWSSCFNQPTAQIYRVSADDARPFRIYGGQQDWGTLRISYLSAPFNYEEDSNNQGWEATAGGESGYVAADPRNSNIVYAGTYKGYMMRKDHSTGQIRSVNIWPVNPAGHGVEVMKYRFNWNFPVFFSPHHPQKLYAASNYLHVTYNEGQSWQLISPDLTRGEHKTLKSSGGPISQDNTGVEFYGTIMAAVESPYEKDVIWTGSDDGLVHVSKDGGKNWKNVTPPSWPQNNMINDISVNPHVKGGAYIAATSYKFGDYTPYLYKTEDYGESWQLITTGINPEYYTRTICADPIRPGLVYAGTEWGMYISFDDGENWSPFQMNLPVVSIRDLLFKNNKLIVATHGRGFWILDELSPLHQMNEPLLQKKFHLFKPSAAYRPGSIEFRYMLKDVAEESIVKFELLEEDGDVIATYSNKSNNKKRLLKVAEGMNTFKWNLCYPGFEKFEGMHFYSSHNKGPLAVPGQYRARLHIDNEVVEQDFEILKDPRIGNSQQEFQQQFDFLMKVRDKVSEANRAVTEIKAIKKKLGRKRMNTKSRKKIRMIDKTINKLSAIEKELFNPQIVGGRDPLKYGVNLNNRLAFLLADQQRGDFPPTDQAVKVFEELSEQLDVELSKLKSLKSIFR